MKKHPFIFASFFTALFLPITFNESALASRLLYVNEITPQTITAFFKQPLSVLNKNKVSIKVLAPKLILRPEDRGIGFYIATADSNRPNRYSIGIGKYENCFRFDECLITFTGAKLIGEVRPNLFNSFYQYIPEVHDLEAYEGGTYYSTLEEALAFSKKLYIRDRFSTRRSPDLPTSLTLDNGMKAVFLPWIGPDYKANSNVSWNDNGVRYQMFMRKGNKADMLKMVNSIYK